MYKFIIKGVVQGVGFRPYIYNACIRAKLKGYILNAGDSVVVEVDNKELFVEILNKIPPLARIDSYEIGQTSNQYDDFTIKESAGQGFAEIPPDLFLCEDCQRELHDRKNRRYNYYFITCTNCGPRFSISKKSPYDRKTITMDVFDMCQECNHEYFNPKDRRYHAQTIACHKCGPRLKLIVNGKKIEESSEQDLIRKTAELIRNNNVIAIKGVGGFHLACNIRLESIEKLREITGRDTKPFAILCKDVDMAKRVAHISDREKKVLLSIQRPIVILRKKSPLYEVCELDTVGIMLPYTALHYLLFDFIDEPIVMTSSNISDEPITTSDNEQIVSNLLTHDRQIENPIDDSLVKVIEEKVFQLRRSRGFVPKSIQVHSSCKKQILALGAELSNAFSIYKDGKIIPSQYMGTTSNINTFTHYKKTMHKFLHYIDCKPDIILVDMHPEYNTSRYGEELSESLHVPLVRIQHHKAHAYSVAAEKDIKDFVGIVCDGLGYGEDGRIWGGEIFHNNKRVGHLEEQYQLGGDSAAIYPAKMLFSILSKFLSLEDCRKYLRDYFTEEQLHILKKQLDERFNCPLTTSSGRILDAASFLLGFCDERTYEGRPAMLLEANSTIPYAFDPIIENNILLTTPLFQYLVDNLDKDKRRLAATVQMYLAQGLYNIASKFGKPIVFSGGCAYNKIMSSFMIKRGVHTNEKVPSGDGGISFGQIGYYLANPRDNVS
ncbi:MAG: carbamoyltransferase HypF [Nanoarchaeota archaeon]